MKNLKRLFAVMIALLLVIPLFGTRVLAADYDGTLTITGLDNNDSVRFFKIVEWNPSSNDAVGGWAPISPMTKAQLQTIIRTATQADVDSGKAQHVGDLIVEGISAELAGTLAKAFKGAQPIATKTAASGKVELKVDDDDPATTDVDESFGPGIYMALITPAPTNVDTVYNPVFVSSDFNKDQGGTWAVTENATYSNEAAAKKSTTYLTKTPSVDEANWQDKEWTTARIGETISFTVETVIPGYGEVYQAPTFIIRDKLTDLILDQNSVTVVEPDDAVYTINPKSADGYTITFDPAYLKTLTVPTVVKVTYTAKVADTADVHVDLERNEVSTEYSHDPTNEGDHKFKKDDTQHYTFTIDAAGLGQTEQYKGKKTSEVVKVGKDASGEPIMTEKQTSDIWKDSEWEGPLKGAHFKLYVDSDCTIEYQPLNPDGTNASKLDIVSGADGRMTIKGLDAGIYYLKEESAPAGFIKPVSPNDVAKIQIIAEMETVDVVKWTKDGVNWLTPAEYEALADADKTDYKKVEYDMNALKTYTVKINDQIAAQYNWANVGEDTEIIWTEEGPIELPHQFVNTQGTELPDTGGIGTTLFYVFGGILVLGAGILLVSRQRMMN